MEKNEGKFLENKKNDNIQKDSINGLRNFTRVEKTQPSLKNNLKNFDEQTKNSDFNSNNASGKTSTHTESESLSSEEKNFTRRSEKVEENKEIYEKYEGINYEEFGEQFYFEQEEPLEEMKSIEVSENESITSPDALSNVYAKLSPFNMKWSFGVKRNIELINLTSENNFEVFYVTSHFGVIYNYCYNTMTFLPGHNYPISSIAADASGRWLVSADAGEDTVIIIWDHQKRLPVWAIYNAFPNEGVKCVKISQDARFLAAINGKLNCTLKFWRWTLGREQPDGEITINSTFGKAKHIDFNHMNTEQFIVTMEFKVIFCEWKCKSQAFNDYTPEFEHSKKKKLGILRESIFLDDNHTCLTSTSQGHVVVWCDTEFTKSINEEIPGTIKKMYLKTVKIQETGITSLRLSDKIIVTSSEDGTVLFHDQQLRLIYSIPKLKLDPLVSISFNLSYVPSESDPFTAKFQDKLNMSLSDEEIENIFEYETINDLPEKNVKEIEELDSAGKDTSQNLSFKHSDSNLSKPDPSDCTLERRPFVMKDFIFLMTSGKIGYFSHKRKKIKYYLYDMEAPIISIDCNPNKNHVVVGNSHGRLTLYEYVQKKMLVSVAMTSPITCLKYSRLGYILMAGLQNGLLLELDPLLLTLKSQIDFSKAQIEKICFSPKDDILSYYDQNSTVYVCVKKHTMRTWNFSGKYISHYKPIKDLMFDETQESSKSPRLFSIGEDRMLVEYDMNNLEENKFNILSVMRIEQTAIPCCFAWLNKVYNTPQFLISNNEYKLKIIDSKTNICQKTTLGPTADTPINFMKMIFDWDQVKSKPKMIYSTQKHIGLRLLPPTGNPFEGMGMVAHPEKITSIAVSHDHKYVFTAGLNDSAALMWIVNPSSVEVSNQLGGIGLEPFVSLIEGGPNSFLFKEIEDFFYYAQIIHQGEDPNLDRSVSKSLALCEIPDLFRALGYYPTDYEVNNILHELKHLNYQETGETVTEVSFDECVKAFLNHRPVHGVSLKDINKALLAIADLTDPSDIIVEKSELYKALEERAEAMDHAEVVGYLCILLLPKDENNPIPPSLSLKDFAENVLGIDFTITEENVRQITHAFEAKFT